MEHERRPFQEEELRHKPLSNEDAYFKKLDEERKRARELKQQARRMVCGRADRPPEGCPLEHVDYHGLVADRCSECGGLWLDEHETELLKRGLEEDPKENLFHRWMKNILPYQK